jgi:anti-sigma factor RsiW
MKCRYSEHDVALFVEGDLEPAKSAELEVHLVTCEVCRELEADVRESQMVLKSLRQEMLSSAALSAVRSRVLEQVSETRVRPMWGRWVYALAGAMFVAVVSVSVVLHNAKPEIKAVAEVMHPDVVVPSARPSVEVEPIVPPAPVERRKHRSSSSNNQSISEPTTSEAPQEVVVKLLTDDPNIVIYWLVDQKNGGTL